jgi:hypothetical protein
MIAIHIGEGVPWQQALDNNFSQSFLEGMAGRESLIPSGHLKYLAITPLSIDRDELAEHLEGNDGVWRDSLDHPDVKKAYINYVKKMVDIFSPDYLNYAIEVNVLFDKEPERWSEFVNLASETYMSIKSQYPDLPVFVSLFAETFHQDTNVQTTAIKEILPYSDYIGVSSYPYVLHANPELLPKDYFFKIADLSPSKPFVIAETGWPAEDISSPYPVLIRSDEEEQRKYLDRLFSDAEEMDWLFITWFFTRDFDIYWDSYLKDLPSAPTNRIWRDTGLYDGDGNSRPALTLWKETLAKKIE